MSAHTPGPWSIQFDKGHTFSDGSVDHGGYRIDAEGVEQLAYVWNFSDRFDPVSGKQEGTHPFGAHEAEANARLISAAPDLLEALIAMEKEKANYMLINNLGDPSNEHTNKQARAAIAKATGETP